MIYNCWIKHNGVLYAPGSNVPEGEAPKPKVEAEVTEVVEPKKEEPKPEKTYKRSDIQTMNVVKLKAVSDELGIEYDDDATKDTLKRAIFAKLGI